MHTFIEAYHSAQKWKLIICIYAINHVFSPLFYILAISNSLRNMVMCIWAKINFSDFNYLIAIHLLGKLEREFKKEIVDRNWKFPLVCNEHIGWRIQDNFRGRVRCQIGLLRSIDPSWINAVTYTLYKGY